MANISLPTPGQKPWSLNPAITAMNNELNGRLGETQLNNSFAAAGELSFSISRYGNLSTGLSSAFNAAANAVPDGSTLVIPPGNYSITSQLSNFGKSLRVLAYGARLNQGFNGLAFNFSGAFESTVSVSSIDTTTSNSRTVTRLNLSSSAPASWAVGDVIRVYSSDPIPERRPGDGTLERRLGQFAVVSSISGTAVGLTGLLLDTYTTNIRAAKLSKKTVAWEGGSFRGSDASISGNWTAGVMTFDSLHLPVLRDFTIERASSTGVRFKACYGYLATGLEINNLGDNAGLGLLGYAVMDSSSANGVFSDSVVTRVRHSFTDDTTTTAANTDDPANNARSTNATVSNVKAIANTSASFSPHHHGAGHTFIGCQAISGQSFAYGLRGKNHIVIGCTQEDCTGAVTCGIDTDGGMSYGHRVVGMRSLNPTTAHFSISSQNAADVLNRYSIEIDGGMYVGGPRWLTVNRANVKISNSPTYIAPAVLPDGSSALALGGGGPKVDCDSLELDYSQNTSGSALVIMSQGGSTPMSMRVNDRVLLKNSTLTGRVSSIFGVSSGGSGNAVWNVNEIIADVETGSLFSGASVAAIRFRTRDFSRRNNVYDRSESGIGASYAAISSNPNETLLINAVGTTNNNRTLGDLPPGVFAGQRLIVSWSNPANTARTLTINNGGTSGVITETGAAIVLAENTHVTLYFDGTVWRKV